MGFNADKALCVLCCSENISIKAEIAVYKFGNKYYQYEKFYMQCDDCQFEFVTYDQHANNLNNRIKSRNEN